jgi:hypothetical protein
MNQATHVLAEIASGKYKVGLLYECQILGDIRGGFGGENRLFGSPICGRHPKTTRQRDSMFDNPRCASRLGAYSPSRNWGKWTGPN